MIYKSKVSIKPKTPLISIYNKGIEIIDSETIKCFNRANAYQLIKDNIDWEMYSSDMKTWKLEQKTDKFKNNTLNRFLAKTIYNPTFEVDVFWEQIEEYLLTELKTKINNCIDADDDILTQFVEADFFKYKIEKSSNFGEIIYSLKRYSFEIENEEAIYKENNEWQKTR